MIRPQSVSDALECPAPRSMTLRPLGVRAVGQHHEAVAAPDLVLGVLLGLLDLGLDFLVVGPVEVCAEHAVAHLPLHAPPREQQLDLVAQVAPRLLQAPDERARIQPRRLAPVLRPLGDLRRGSIAAVPFAARVDDDERQPRRVRHRAAVARERHDGNARAALKLLLDELAHRRLDLVLLVERRTPVVNHLLHLGLVEDPEAVRADLRMKNALASSATAALSIDVVSSSGSPRAKRSSGRCATLSIWPPDDSNRIAVPTRRWMSRRAPLRVGVERPGVGLVAGDVGVDRGDEPRLAELAQHDAAELGHVRAAPSRA